MLEFLVGFGCGALTGLPWLFVWRDAMSRVRELERDMALRVSEAYTARSRPDDYVDMQRRIELENRSLDETFKGREFTDEEDAELELDEAESLLLDELLPADAHTGGRDR